MTSFRHWRYRCSDRVWHRTKFYIWCLFWPFDWTSTNIAHLSLYMSGSDCLVLAHGRCPPDGQVNKGWGHRTLDYTSYGLSRYNQALECLSQDWKTSNTDPRKHWLCLPHLHDLLSTCSTTKTSLVSSDWPHHMVDVHQYLTEETKDRAIQGIGEICGYVCAWNPFLNSNSKQDFWSQAHSFSFLTSVRLLELTIWIKNGCHWWELT